MVENDLEIEKGEDSGVNESRDESKRPVFRREPSFSRWCDEDGIEHLDCSRDSADVSVDDCDFELPLLQGDGSENVSLDREKLQFSKFQQRSMRLNGGHGMENASVYMEENTHGNKYVPFDIENEGFTANDVISRRKQERAQTIQSSISTATVLRTLFCILVWYTFSTCLTIYNKALLGDKLGKFPAPLLMNTVHFSMQAVLSWIIVQLKSQTLQPSVRMSWRDYFTRVVPTAVGTALDINLSNASLVFISVTFATMCKSAAPIFLLLFAFAFKLESPSFKLFGIIFVISIGVLLTVAKETEFEFWGFVFVMLAAVMSGFRWSMTQILLQKEAYGLKHPITLMSYVTPVMAVATALLSLMLDPWDKFKSNVYFNNPWHILRSCLLMLIGGALAFCFNRIHSYFSNQCSNGNNSRCCQGGCHYFGCSVLLPRSVYLVEGDWAHHNNGWCEFVQLVQIPKATGGPDT
ncbi:putative sugar phosphate/phosphate translocator At1g06470 isoform X2 [Tasmannia lanceolata]|uniref:putative sugar phosphate/phosphate translocator At1g06470 isoform X2 n=1 Tax=Tasmannia lanceolata TaxID=3420 RepID=UPI0040647E27